jgi:hypothetical protein
LLLILLLLLTTTNNVFPKDHQDEEATNNGVGKVGYSHHDDNHNEYNDAHSISNNLSQEVTRRRVVGSGKKASVQQKEEHTRHKRDEMSAATQLEKNSKIPLPKSYQNHSLS